MSKKSILVYDCEIIKGIPPENILQRQKDIEYCAGWSDHAHMGISVIGAYDYEEDRYRVFLRDNFDQFQELINNREILVGFNNINFDDKLIVENGFMLHLLTIDKLVTNQKPIRSYDLLRETWQAASLDPDGPLSKAHAGFRLDDIAKSNFGLAKSGNGALAPIEWQRGQYGSVIDYCIMDVKLTKMLMDQVLDKGIVFDPRAGYREVPLKLRNPFEE